MKQMKPRSFPIRSVESFTYESSVMNTDYDICVGLPLKYAEKPEKQYPMLIVLDGNDHFSTVNTLARGMLGDISELIVVGVDIPIELDYSRYLKRRMYQFSPDDKWPMTDAYGELVNAYFEDVSGSSYSIHNGIGGAPHFYEFLISELLPELCQAYRIDSADIGLVGNSLAGFFTCYVMFKEQSPFCKYMASSPAMAFSDGEIFRIEKRWSDSHSNLSAKIYMGAGMRELNHELNEGFGQIVSGMSKLTGQLLLRNYPSLEIQSDLYEGIGHIDSLSVAVARGLRKLFQNGHEIESNG